MAITDLTGTTWYVPSGWSATSGLGEFNINGHFKATFSTGEAENDFKALWLGYNNPGLLANWLVIYLASSGTTNYSSGTLFIFTFTGGDDVDDPDLISWLTTYGIQLKVTDLTNTTWNVAAGWEAEAGYGEFNVTGRLISQTCNFTAISIGEDDGDYKDNYLCFTPYMAIGNGEVANMSITGGTDIKNPKLIAWLSKWGELQVEEEGEAPPDDLTGYTVTVPAGWSCVASFGNFDIQADLFINGSSVGFIEAVDIGFTLDWEEGEMIPSSNVIYFRYIAAQVDSSDSFVLSNISYLDASNSTFIQWLVDNNATFTKEGGEEEPDSPEEPTVTPQGEIYYKGELVANLVEGETIVLHTKDFKFLGDIVIKNVGEVEEEAPTLISFTIGNTTYQAEEGMTWADWCASEYNTDGWYEHPMTGTPSDGYVAVTFVTMEDEIIADTEYNTGSLPEGIG